MQATGNPRRKGTKTRMSLKQFLSVCLIACMFYRLSIYDPSGSVASTTRVGNSPTSSTHASCVFVKWPAGWGNTLLGFLNHVARNARHNGNAEAVFPCVRGYGEIFGKLFHNLKQCPLEDPIEQCAGHPSKRKEGKLNKSDWDEMRRTIKEAQSNFPTMLQLNVTFVDEVFAAAGASFTLEHLRLASACDHIVDEISMSRSIYIVIPCSLSVLSLSSTQAYLKELFPRSEASFSYFSLVRLSIPPSL